MKKKKKKVSASAKKQMSKFTSQMKSKKSAGAKKASAKSSAKTKSRSAETNKTKKMPMKTQKEAPIKAGTPQKRMDKKSSVSEQSAKPGAEDIIQLCLKDHVALKELIEIMKDDEAEDTDKEEAFEKFAILLKRHAKPEEQTLYVRMKEDEDLRADGFEGDTEHALADQLIKEINGAKDDDIWCAKVKVLAELVEHHIEEEEEEMFPECEEAIKASERAELGNHYLLLQTQYENPDEDTDETPEKLSADAAEDEEFEHKDAEVAEEDESEEEDSDDSPSHHA